MGGKDDDADEDVILSHSLWLTLISRRNPEQSNKPIVTHFPFKFEK